MPLLRTAAAAVAAGSLAYAPAPANAILDKCTADVTITSVPWSHNRADITAKLVGTCPTATTRDEMECRLLLSGAPGVVEEAYTVGTTDTGCTATAVISGYRLTPYVAVNTTSTFGVLLPGVDANAIVG